MKNLLNINKLPVIIAALGVFTGCGEKYHEIDYFGSFFYDSVTVGTIRVEYDMILSQGATQEMTSFENVGEWLDFYDIASATKKRSILIDDNMSSRIIPETRFVSPWLLYHKGDNRDVEMMNVETGQKWLIKKGFSYLKGISSKGNYALLENSIVKRDGILFRKIAGIPIYFDEDSMFTIEMVDGPTSTGISIIKCNLQNGTTDTLAIPPQQNTTRMVENNKYVKVSSAIDTGFYGPYTTCGLVELSAFLSQNFTAAPLVTGACDDIKEYLVEKGYCLITGTIYRLNDFSIYKTIFAGSQELK
jgi:hypothetical protein